MRLLLAACTVATWGAFSSFAQAGSSAVDIKFDAVLNGQPLKCGQTYTGVGSTGATLKLQDFRIYVSKFSLIDAAGRDVPVKLVADGVWQDDKVALLDFEDATGNCNGNAPTHTSVHGEVPSGTYRGLAFQIGVPFEINHQDPTLSPAPLNLSALAWVWRYGFKFTTIDLATLPAQGKSASASGFSVHLGSTGCGEGSMTSPPTIVCSNPNRPEYRFAKFNVSSNTVVLDLGDLLVKTDITTNAPKSTSGCMSSEDDDDCVAIMDRFGLPFRTKPSGGQHFVSVR